MSDEIAAARARQQHAAEEAQRQRAEAFAHEARRRVVERAVEVSAMYEAEERAAVAFAVSHDGDGVHVTVRGESAHIECRVAGRRQALKHVLRSLHEACPGIDVEPLCALALDACDADHDPEPREAGHHLSWAEAWSIVAREMGEHDASTWAWSLAVRRLLWGLLAP